MSLKGTVWTPIGPSPISEGGTQDNGLVTAIAVNPYNPSVIYIGTAAGGVWRTRDAGTTWTPLFDRQPALGIGEPGGVAIDPNNTDVIYAGTSQRVMLGTGNTGIFGLPDSSQGLFKSIDGGNSWIQLGAGFPVGNTGNAINLVGVNINVILVDPANSQRLYLGTANGVRISVDGGQNWTSGTGAFGDTRALVLDTSSPVASRILYAGISGRGAFRSNDGGQNWTQILSGSTPAVSAAIGPPPKGFNKVIIAIAPPASPPNAAGVQVLYVTLEGTGGASDPVGLFMSTDQGATWTQRTATGMPTRTQGGYSFHIAVDPASPGNGANDIIYFGTVSQAKSTNSGGSFSAMSVPHADTHAWAFVSQTSPTPSIVFCGNDGGIDRSTDGGATWTTLNSGGLQTGLFFNIDIKPDATGSVVVGSAQDNGLQTTAGVASPMWNSPQGGDGFDIAYDGVTPGRIYGTSGFWPAPCTRVFVSTADATDLSPTVPTSQDITPWGTTSDQNCGVFPITTSPTNAGHVYVSGNQNLWQTTNGGSSWRILSPFATTGDVDVAPANPNFVVIAVGKRVFVSTNALAATVGPPSGVTFTDITRNLPSRNVARVLFDPVDPTVIYAVLGGLNGSGSGQSGHVFRTTVGGTSWTDISPTAGVPAAELNIPCNAIALDGTDVPTTIYVGTDIGVLRSVDSGASWSVLDDIHFPRVTVSDLVLNQAAGVLCAATYGRGVFKFAMPTGPVVAVNLENNLLFGTVCKGPAFLTIEVYNVGVKDLVISSVQRLMGSTAFAVLPTPGTPLVLAAGEDIEFTVQYAPITAGVADVAIIRISSNDPTASFVDVTATGKLGTGAVATAIADNGDFGNVCVGKIADELLTINNPGVCPLSISNITSSSADFQVPGVLSYPLRVGAGESIDVMIRFRPTSFGAKSGAIRVFSDDPAGSHTVAVSGVAPAPRLTLIFADTGEFGKVCIGCFVDKLLDLNDSGKCTLTISGIASSSAEFIVPEVLSYPITIGPGDSLAIPIRFAPTSFGAKSATITVNSDDPAGPRTIDVSGLVPSGKLAVTGSTSFGGVTACCCADRTLSICNVGECDLHVTSVRFKRKSHHWKLLHNPFPATLHAGSCLDVVIRYKATEKCARSCELIIESDDPSTPVRTLEVLAYTIWEPCGCKECCEDCRKGCCDKHHTDHCCRQGYPCCDDDDEDDEED
jgi:ASPM-SPD-2-Hydin domain-containing protein/HYDIN/CFA65/VesB family protein